MFSNNVNEPMEDAQRNITTKIETNENQKSNRLHQDSDALEELAQVSEVKMRDVQENKNID